MEINSVDCPKCGGNIAEEIRQGKVFKCSNCGSTLVWPDSKTKLVLSFGLKLCPKCGIDNEQNRNYCRNCGAELTKTCFICKANFYVGDSFCPNGHNYENESQLYKDRVLLQEKEKIRKEKQENLQRIEKLGIEVLVCPKCNT